CFSSSLRGALATKQSRLPPRKDSGLLRCARNDENNHRKLNPMSVRIVDVRAITKPISSPIRNAYIDFTKMTTSLVAVVTDVVRDGKRVVGFGFNSNGRYGQGGLIRERFAPRLSEADPKTLLDPTGDTLDPD